MAFVVVVQGGARYRIEDAEDLEVDEDVCLFQDRAERTIAAFPVANILYVEREGAVQDVRVKARPSDTEALAPLVD